MCHDFEDALSVGIVAMTDLPELVRERCGSRRGQQLGTFINAMITTTRTSGVIGMDAEFADALAAFRSFNYERIYLRGSSLDQASIVVEMLGELVEFFSAHPQKIPDVAERDDGLASLDPVHEAVAYVAGMTDRFACRSAVEFLGWAPERLPSTLDR